MANVNDVMSALKIILPAGTAIQQTVIESALDGIAGGWPALIIAMPKNKQERHGPGVPGLWQPTHLIVVTYLDPWDSGTRTIEQMWRDARTAISSLEANAKANPFLPLNGVDTTKELLELEDEFEGVISDKELPEPMFRATVYLTYRGEWLYS